MARVKPLMREGKSNVNEIIRNHKTAVRSGLGTQGSGLAVAGAHSPELSAHIPAGFGTRSTSYWSSSIVVGASAAAPRPPHLRCALDLRCLVLRSLLAAGMAFGGLGAIGAGAAEQKGGPPAPEAAAKAAAPANDMISLETDAKVTTRSFRRQLEPEQAAARAKMKRLEGTMTGVVGATGTNGLSLSFGVTGNAEQERWLPFEAGLKLVGYPRLSDVRQGDTVNVTYEYLEDGSELFLKRLLLLKRAPEGQP